MASRKDLQLKGSPKKKEDHSATAKSKGKKEALPSTAVTRLRKDFARLISDPVPYVAATPLMDNILEWRYVLTGPEDTPYEGGYYHGRIIFPPDYPFKPPSILMITPNGRFKCHSRICLSMSDFHPETWMPSWSSSTILTGLLSFMLEEQPATGCIKTTNEMKRKHAKESLAFNLADVQFCELFPELAKELRAKLDKKAAAKKAAKKAVKEAAKEAAGKPSETASAQQYD